MPFATRLLMPVLLSLLSACSINGSYLDSPNTDAAKLRYVSNNESATLDLFDDAHCDGRTTGMLNNLFLADTKRRADMIVPPLPGAGSYYEFRLEPGQPVHVRAGTADASTLCGVSFTLTPQAGSEYELSFDKTPGHCTALLTRLQRVDGKDQRTAYPMVNTIPPACVGKSPLFPGPFTPLPDTAERTALIDSIIHASIPPAAAHLESLSAQAATMRIRPAMQMAARKRALSFEMPESYWQQYSQNLDSYVEALAQLDQRAFKRFERENQDYMRSVSTELLKVWAGKGGDASVRERRIKGMRTFYDYVLQQTRAQIDLDYLRSMADLDRREGVCERYAGCWKL